ncbi:extracellular serine/threonine protein kinase four-jointed [Octopus sinensis]|uniref:Extracellular serine/threonine protein kinase four-jointed n=1 Tax=Octopus sinensis TaxID=2607531 RepID=A0A6P7T7M5_9MOLL|nr:extracellular serine/threonine protein kinase four-jointed [Octopus sinensis]XP_036365775.1 extracellular serine/threonine protein kinase four-jointed [Octopus sinensis]
MAKTYQPNSGVVCQSSQSNLVVEPCKYSDCESAVTAVIKRFELSMKFIVLFMTGLGFFFGILVGLLIQLPGVTVPSDFVRTSSKDVRVDIKESHHRYQEPTEGPLAQQIQRVIVAREILNEKSHGQMQKTDLAVVQNTNNSLEIKEEILKKSPYPDAPYQETNNQETLLNADVKPEIPINAVLRFTQLSAANNSNKKPSQVVKGAAETKKLAGNSSVVNGVFWQPSVEKLCVVGFSKERRSNWRRKAGILQIVKMEEGCGRMQNRLLTFRDSSKACARYRLNTDQIQGDIFSYYLSQILKISNLPPSIALAVQPRDIKWSDIHEEIAQSQWVEDQVVIVSEWIEGLEPTFIPKEFRNEGLHLNPISDSLSRKSQKELCELVQWSDLIVFDYLIANLDRVVNNMFNKQWNANMMSNPAHNLQKVPSNEQLVFLDNESGLFHGYRLLDKYSSYHHSMLQSLCVFRKSTAKAIERLHFTGDIGKELKEEFIKNEKFHYLIPSLPEKNVKILQERISEVYAQIQKCQDKYTYKTTQ